jgi:hypothetical protein
VGAEAPQQLGASAEPQILSSRIVLIGDETAPRDELALGHGWARHRLATRFLPENLILRENREIIREARPPPADEQELIPTPSAERTPGTPR